MLRYAQVVVLLPIDRRPEREEDAEGGETLVEFAPERQTFTYGIPPARRGQILPGQLIWVPFGRSRQQGVVMSLSERVPEGAPAGMEIKPVGEPVMAEPLLSPAQIELALWLSRHYLAPLSECVRLFLPPGAGAKSQVVVEHTPGAPIPVDELTPAQQALLLRLRKEPVLLRDLRQIDRRLAADEILGDLLEKGLARLRDRVTTAPPQPKTERRVGLLILPGEIDERLLHLGRASKKAELLTWLIQHPDAVSAPAALAPPAVVQDLEKQGWVARTEAGGARLAVSPEAATLAALDLRGTARLRPILHKLVEAGAEPGGQPVWVGWLYAEAGADAAVLQRLAGAGLVAISEVQTWRDPLAGRVFASDTLPSLTQDQQRAWDAIEAAIAESSAEPPVFLLHGVTGSGKTELYLRALAKVTASGRQGIVLVPEISLTPQTVRRFAARFPGRVAVVHSQLSEGERYDTWQRARLGEFDVVIGSRSALFTPFPRPGVIILDEEHDGAYKQMRTPRYHARDAAVELARLSGAVTLLGSATPSLESMFQARRGRYHLLALPQRVRGHRLASDAADLPDMLELPPVAVVDMRAELRAGNRSMFSRRLSAALQQVLDRREQAILFLNRRGGASFVLCRDCGEVMHCPRCAIPLTHHGGATLICHHCNHRQPMPNACPKCHGRRFREFGAGTERLIEALQAEFPGTRPLRWDRDTTGGKSSHDAILQEFIDHQADVLVGTQMIAKGLDLPLVTLVGVISADVGLFLPDIRAAERVFQVLMQVAGRAGRSALGGEVIFQTYHPDHYALLAASQHDYAAFYQREMQYRQEHGYPPYRRLTRLLYQDSNRERCQQETARVADLLRQRAAALGLEEPGLIGPAPAFFSKERDMLRWHLFMRAEDPAALLAGVRLTPNWRIDVDPVETL